jgi:hypothetical protein
LGWSQAQALATNVNLIVIGVRGRVEMFNEMLKAFSGKKLPKGEFASKWREHKKNLKKRAR